MVAIRAVSGDDVVTAAEVQSDGRFRIALPAGARYRLEVLTSGGVKQLLAHQDGTWKGLETTVCIATDPFDMGTVGDSGTMCDPNEPGCGCGDDLPPQCDPMDPKYDPMDPNCKPPEPPPACGGPNEPPCPECMDPTDPDCKPCGGPNEPPCPCMDPMDPNCQPPSCGGPNEPPCPDDPCTDPMDPNCKPPPCMDPMDPNCGGTDPDPNCMDPMDPDTCKDPCVIDPMQCGCNAGEMCWPPPEPPKCMDPSNDTMCDPADTMTPTNVPGDFGCVTMIGGK